MGIKILFSSLSLVFLLSAIQLVGVDGVAMKSSCSSRKTSIEECKAWCEQSERCGAFTYYADIHRCVPKSKTGWEKASVKRVHSGLAHNDEIENDVEYQRGDMGHPCPTREML